MSNKIVSVNSFVLSVALFICGVFYAPFAFSHPHLEAGAIPAFIGTPITDYKDGFGSSRVELLIDEGIALGYDAAADLACPNTNASCLSVSTRHSATTAEINNIVDTYFEDYAEWWQIIFWEGCPKTVEIPATPLMAPSTDLCFTSGKSKGILGVLPKVQEQVSTSRLKTVEIRQKTLTSKKMDDAKRVIQEKKVKALNESYPSEDLCKFASMIGGAPKAKLQSEITFNDSMTSVRYAVSLGSAAMGDEKARSKIAVENYICKDANYGDNDSVQALCGTIVADTEKKNIGELSHKGTWNDDDRNVAIESTSTMFASNRPSNFVAATLNNDKGKEAYMNHRSVMSREMLGSYCFLKTQQDRMGGSDTTLPYLQALLRDYDFTEDLITEMLGDSPSLYTQKKILLMLANQPTIGNDITDNKENILRLSNVIEGYKLSAMYDALDVMYCNQMISAQLFTDELLPFGTDVQQKIDSLRVANSSNKTTNYANINKHLTDGGI